MKKLTRALSSFVLTTAFVISNIGAAFASGNEPVSGAEVTLCTFNSSGVLEAVGAPVTTDSDGNFEAELPANIPAHTPVFACAQSADGTGAPQVSYVDPKSKKATVDPAATAVTNTLISFMGSTDAVDAQDLDAGVVDEFFDIMEPVLKEVPPADSTGDTVSRMADALSFHPDAFLLATRKLPIPANEKLSTAAQISTAAAPAGFNPFGGEAPPELDLDAIPAGSHTAALINPRLMSKFTPKNFDFNEEFGDAVLPPGGLAGKIPEGAFMFPSGLKISDKHGELPDEVVLPVGVEIPVNVKLSPNTVIPPGAIIGEGWIPPEDMLLPPGLIMPEDFDPTEHGAFIQEEWEAPEGFVPPPGFTLLDKAGGIGLPPTFKMKAGFEFDPEAEVHMFSAEDIPGYADIQKKYDKLAKGFIDPFEEGFVGHFDDGYEFGEDAILDPRFNPEQFGTIPPAHFERHEFGGNPADFEKYKAEGFEFFIPEGHNFDPATFFGPPMVNGQPVAGLFHSNNIPEGAVIPGEFTPPEGHVGPWDPFADYKGDYKEPLDPAIGPDGEPLDPSDPKLEDGSNLLDEDGDGNYPEFKEGEEHEGEFGDEPKEGDPNYNPANPGEPLDQDPNAGSEDGHKDSNQDYADPGNDDYHPDDNYQDQTGSNDPGPDPVYNNPDPGGEHEYVARSYRTLTRAKDGSKRMVGTLSTGDVNDIALPAPEGTNAKNGGKVTASAGVYSVGKTTSNSDTVRMSIIVDPSISDESVKVNLKVDNEIETEIIDVDNQAIQLVTQKSGNNIEVSTVNTDVEFSSTKFKGYLLEPGTSTTKMQKAIPVTGTVVVGDNTSVVKFAIPEKAQISGLHTVTFTDGSQTYFGKVTLGTVKAKTISGKVLAPGGRL